MDSIYVHARWRREYGTIPFQVGVPHVHRIVNKKKKKFLSSHIFLAVGGIPPESGIYIPSDNNSSNAFKMQ